MDFSFSKQGLLDALEARRAWAVALDKKEAAAHAKAETVAFQKFKVNVAKERVRALASVKKQCDDAAKATYEQAKQGCQYHGAYAGHLNNMDFDKDIVWPACPKSTVQRLDNNITWIKADGRKHYRIRKGGELSNIHYLLTYNENAKPDVCK